MTIREAILSYFTFEVPENLVEKVVIDRAIKDEQVYMITDKQTVEVAVADVCGGVLLLDSVSEGGLSIKYDKGALRALRTEIMMRYGLNDELGSTISSRKVW